MGDLILSRLLPRQVNPFPGHGVLPDRVTTINANRGSSNEVRSPRRQEHSRSSHFLWLTPSPSRSPRKNLIIHHAHGRCSHRRRHICLNPSWRDRVHLNVVRGKFDGHRLGQLHNRTFRCAVRRDQCGSKERIHTADVDNLSTFPTQHRSRNELGKKKHRIELRLDMTLPPQNVSLSKLL
jgi:hypothetical protein